MKYRLLPLLMLLLATTVAAKANPVDLRTAREAGAKFLNANTKTEVMRSDDLQLVSTYRTADGTAAFHVFNTPEGFVIVSADDCATPILGYSDEGRPFDPNNIPIQMQEYLQLFVEQIQYGIENHLEADETIAQQWTMVMQDGRLNNNRTVTAVQPMLVTTWDQGCLYNNLCPTDPEGQCGHVWAGCVATAMAQIMNFWGYPYKGQGSHSYIPEGYPEQSANFGNTQYDWAHMPNALTNSSTSTQINAVATLMWHCGVATDMMYGANASAAYDNDARDALVNYFKYSDDIVLDNKKYRQLVPGIGYVWLDKYTDEEWKAFVKEDLDLGWPVFYTASSGSAGHAFVIDGYDADENWHINWGWGGQGDGYFAFGALNVFEYQWNTNPWMIHDIHPRCTPGTTYQVSASAYPAAGGTISGAGSFICSESCTLTATANEGYTFLYWMENDSIISYFPSLGFNVDEARTLTAHFAVNFTVEAEPEGYGSFSVEGASFVPNGPSVYTRITDVSELMPGDRIIFAARYNDVANQYAAVKNELDSSFVSMFLSTTLFTSQNNGNNEILAADIVNQERDYYWTLGVTEEGYYIFTNTLGQVLSVYDYNSWFTINSGNRNWTVASGVAAANALVPNYAGFIISEVNRGKSFAFREGGDVPRTCWPIDYIANEEYNYYFDIFRQPCEVYTAPYGSTVTLTAIPNEGNYFLNWTKNGTVVSTNLDYSFTVTENANYVAHFDDNPVVTVTANPEMGGTVTGAGTYAYGATATMTATANENYTFQNWTVNGTVVSTENPYSFTVTEDVSLVANFFTNPIITVSCEPESSGYLRLEGLELMHDEAYQYTRITDIGELHDNDRIILAARYNSNAGHYVALKNTLDNRALPSTEFVSVVIDNRETIPNSILDEEMAYLWTVGLSEDGRYTLTNSGEYSIGANFSGFTMNNSYFYWNISAGVSDFDAMVPEYEGFTIINGDKGFAIDTDHVCLATNVSNMAGSNAPNYNFYLDIFKVTSNHYTCNYGDTVNITAMPAENHSLFNWTKNGQEVCTDPTYTFIATENADYVAHIIPNPTITVAVSPEGSGTFHFENYVGLTPHDGLGQYVRLSDLGDLSDGDQIILAARYSIYEHHSYKALSNTLNDNGFLTGTTFVSVTNGDLEILPSDIADYNQNYLWTVHISNGNYFLTNTVGDTIGYNSYMYFDMNGDNTAWTMAMGTSDAGAMMPSYTGFTITNATTTNRAFALDNEGKCGAFHTSYMTGNNAPNYNFFLDIFKQQYYEMETYTGLAAYGSSITLSATANEGFNFFNWTRNGTVVSNDATATFTIGTDDAAFVANFSDNHVNISVAADPETGGTVSGGGVFIIGDECTLTATVNTAYNFVNWTKNGAVVSTQAVYTFTVTESAQYVAHFATYPVTITVAASPSIGGTVTGGGTYNTHTTCNLTAIPNSGYYFIGWTKDGIGVSGSANYSFTVLEGGDYVAHFEMYTPSDLLYSINSDSLTVTVTGHANGTNATGSLVIPETVQLEYWNGYANVMGSFTVTIIGGNAFKDCVGLTGSLVIPNTVTEIRYDAFQNCTGFTGSLTIAESVTHIGSGAFANTGFTILNYNAINCVLPYGSNWLDNCTALTTLTLGNNVESIPPSAFSCYRNVNWVYHHNFSGELVLPNSLIWIGVDAFNGCSGFTGDLVIPNSVTLIGQRAFLGCTGFSGSLTLSNTIETILKEAFWNCSGFTGNLVIPNSVTSIGDGAFANCSGFNGDLVISNSLTTINQNVFANCSGFTGDLIIPNSVTTIGEYAFYECTGFTGSLTIPNSVTTIGSNAFKNCYGLSGSLTIGESVNSISYQAFYQCNGFSSIYVLPITPPVLNYSVFSAYDAQVYVPCGALDTYLNHYLGYSWSDYFYYPLLENCTEPIQISATANPAEGGTISGAGIYYEGYDCTLTATANEDYTFINWTRDGEEVSTEAEYTFTVTEDAAFVANFVQTCQITATASPTEGGTVSGAGTYYEGYDCTLTATANEGYTFVNWTRNGEVVSESESYTFTVTESVEYVAHFIVSAYVTITATANPADYGTVSGGGSYFTGTTCTLTATANDGYNFESWTKNGVVVSTNPIYSFKVFDAAEYVANFEAISVDITQTTTFVNGWTWWSTCIETVGADVLGQLKTGLGNSGQVIKSQTASTMHLGNNWVGSLTMTNENGYMVKANAEVTVDITGPATTPENHTITLNSGWTWIGYPNTETMSVSAALANHTPQPNDVIKGQSVSAMYMAGAWRGALTLTPGIGLMYKSNSSEAVTLTYATPTRNDIVEANEEESHWRANYTAYPTNMTVLAVVELDGKELNSENYELAAFVNGECRGSVRLMNIELLNRHFALLTVSGEEAAELRFALYNTETGEEYHDAIETLTYEADAVVGGPETPFVVRFRNTTGVDEWANSLQIFPNPVEHGQNINLGKTDELGMVQVEIINALGAVVETQSIASLQNVTAPNTAGVYTLRITVEGKGTCYRKLIVR